MFIQVPVQRFSLLMDLLRLSETFIEEPPQQQHFEIYPIYLFIFSLKDLFYLHLYILVEITKKKIFGKPKPQTTTTNL